MQIVFLVVQACDIGVLAGLEELCEDVDLVFILVTLTRFEQLKQVRIDQMHVPVAQISED